MAEVHEGICGTHQSAPKKKWLLRWTCFYCPTMIADCFRHYKVREECQKHGDVHFVPAVLLQPNYQDLAILRIGNVRTMCGSRTGGWSLPGVMSD
jgi:hypothetical protein